MKLILYSSGNFALNSKLDNELFRLAGTRRPRMVYVPDILTEPKFYYEEWKSHYESLGVTDFTYFPLKGPFNKSLLKEVFSSEVIYFSGGNTFTFLRNLKKSGLETHIRKFLKNGGVLSGCSAGAILMTPNIMTAKVPSKDADKNNFRIRNLKAMNLIGFEFSPHYVKNASVDNELLEYSRLTPRPIYGCSDGSGLVVSGKRVRFVGRIVEFHKGKKSSVRRRWTQVGATK